jgi:putative acetyltransferase
VSAVLIRDERAEDAAAIRRVTTEAFAGHPHSEGTEPAIVEALRTDGDLALSLVAECAGEVVGHAAFSNAILSTGKSGWFVLGPISVAPERQGRGIGRALIERGCAKLREHGARGVVVLGDPAYYSRFGFGCGTPLRIEGPLADYFQVLPFTDAVPDAVVAFAPAYGVSRVHTR